MRKLTQDDFIRVRQQEARKLRSQAGDKMPDLLKKQKSHCYFCQNLISQQTSKYKSDKSGYITMANGKTRRLATIEHIIPLIAGGKNNKENIVAACYQCNQDRNRQYIQENNIKYTMRNKGV